MRLPTIRFKLRSLMSAAVGIAVILAVEAIFFQAAVQMVKSHDDYLWNEAVTVWVILNIAVILPPAVWAAACARATLRDHAQSEQRSG
jgi:hypothetical protein